MTENQVNIARRSLRKYKIAAKRTYYFDLNLIFFQWKNRKFEFILMKLLRVREMNSINASFCVYEIKILLHSYSYTSCIVYNNT